MDSFRPPHHCSYFLPSYLLTFLPSYIPIFPCCSPSLSGKMTSIFSLELTPAKLEEFGAIAMFCTTSEHKRRGSSVVVTSPAVPGSTPGSTLGSATSSSLVAAATPPPRNRMRVSGGEEVYVVVEVSPEYDGEFKGVVSIVPERDGMETSTNGLEINVKGNANSNLLHFDLLQPMDFGRLRLGQEKIIKRRLINHCGMGCDFHIELDHEEEGGGPKWTVSPNQGRLESESSMEIVFVMTLPTDMITFVGTVEHLHENDDDVDEASEFIYGVEIRVINYSMDNRVDSRVEGSGGLAAPKMKVVVVDDSDVRKMFPARMDLGTVVVGENIFRDIILTNVGTGSMIFDINVRSEEKDDDSIRLECVETNKGEREKKEEKVVGKDKDKEEENGREIMSLTIEQGETINYRMIFEPKEERKYSYLLTLKTDAEPEVWTCQMKANGVRWLIVEEWPSRIDLGRVVMGDSAVNFTFAMKNGGPASYPLSFKLCAASAGATKDDEGKEEEQEKIGGWSVVPTTSLQIPPAPGSSNVTVSWSTPFPTSKLSADTSMLVLTREQYQDHLNMVRSTPKNIKLKMFMASNRIEYIPMSCIPEILTCRVVVCQNIIGGEKNNNEDKSEEEEKDQESLSFGACLIEQRVTRRIKICNFTNYYLPYVLRFNQSLFFSSDTNNNQGVVPPSSAKYVHVAFHPSDTFDTEESDHATLSVVLMHGLMEGGRTIELRARTQEFLFNSRLLGSIMFGNIFLGVLTLFLEPVFCSVTSGCDATVWWIASRQRFLKKLIHFFHLFA